MPDVNGRLFLSFADSRYRRGEARARRRRRKEENVGQSRRKIQTLSHDLLSKESVPFCKNKHLPRT